MRGSLQARRGTTLLEVMFAIGVAGIGILGVAVLLPVAGHQAARGRVFDKVASHGKNAVQAFELAGGTRPSNWTFARSADNNGDGTPDDLNGDGAADIGLSIVAPVLPPLTPSDKPGIFPYQPMAPPPAPPTATSRTSIPGTGHRRSFCIDPLFAATNLYDGSNPQVFRFPASRSAMSMERITLRQSSGGALGHVLNSDPTFPTSILGGAMLRFQAEQLCMAGDDLNFKKLDPRQEMPPLQQWQEIGGIPARRQSEGKATWMAVITPKVDEVTPIGESDDFNLTIVVFDRRQVPLFSIPGNPDPERVVEVQTISGSGYRGGQMLLIAPTELDLALEHGQWIMLTGFMVPNAPIGPMTTPMPVHKWYKVVAADEQARFNTSASPNRWERWVTLDGPDWPVPAPLSAPPPPIAAQMAGSAPTRSEAQAASLANALPDYDGDNSPDPYRIEATLMNGVIGVYEKTIRLEGSSLWMN